ncbi:MAG: hypothetical protein WAX44_04535 [Minisyncoccia bacterium]
MKRKPNYDLLVIVQELKSGEFELRRQFSFALNARSEIRAINEAMAEFMHCVGQSHKGMRVTAQLQMNKGRERGVIIKNFELWSLGYTVI